MGLFLLRSYALSNELCQNTTASYGKHAVIAVKSSFEVKLSLCIKHEIRDH